MNTNDEYYPPDIDPLPDDHPFFKELAGLIEEHEESNEERYRFFCACVDFGETWKTEPGSW